MFVRPLLGPPFKHGAEHVDDRGRKVNDYKLLVDPAIHKGQQKLYRFNGVIPGDPASKVIITDPRRRVARLLTKSKQADLAVPQFKVTMHSTLTSFCRLMSIYSHFSMANASFFVRSDLKLRYPCVYCLQRLMNTMLEFLLQEK